MRYVVVGAGIAGLSAAESILDLDPGAEVTLFSEEEDAPYCRPLVSYWLSRHVSETLFPLRPRVLARVDLRLGVHVRALDLPARLLHTASGQEIAYDRLLLATGAAPVSLGAPGEVLPNVTCLRTWDDARRIDAEIRQGARRALVLGGGLVGVKAAEALAARGVRATLCVSSSHPLSQAVDRKAGALVVDALGEKGVQVRTGLSAVSVEEEGGRAAAVVFGDGSREPCDLVVVGKGVAPRAELLGSSGTGVDGVAVDNFLRTPLPDVWAAGDAALVFDVAWQRPRLNALWPLAAEQGALAGRNMAGAGEAYPGSLAMNSLRVGRLELVSAGITRAPDASYEERSSEDRAGRLYRKVVTRGGRLVGMIHVGRADQAGLVISAIRRGARLEELPFDPLDAGIHWGRHAFAASPIRAEAFAPAGGAP